MNKWACNAAQFSTATKMLASVRDTARPVISTSTMHRPKGMEWDHVLIVGIVEGYMPIFHVKAGDVAGRRQERNALLVA